jgi:hypothetical protein
MTTSSELAGLTVNDISDTEAEYTYTLNSVEAYGVNDYANLYFRISRQGDAGGPSIGRRRLLVDFVELEVPDARIPQPVITVPLMMDTALDL